ncbi:DNA cytosine methyltransferase [Enemella evansiae]|uniref:DNA cytosine methyltransferase n=1 Tax=Enemella evansiae TaxID=2016499 RepID=UPI001E2F9EDE|nr:DNA cytosine methyltransferase [Enemella evansiae]
MQHGSEPFFQVVSSVEMDERACDTLRLRSALRKSSTSDRFPDSYYDLLDRAELRTPSQSAVDAFLGRPEIADAYEEARHEVQHMELGPESRGETDAEISRALDGAKDWVLIGGPPCQAYSIAGRSRRKNDEDFLKDKKHFLFKEYLHILREFEPAVFVMENVKGLLSSTHGDIRMIELILEDLSLGDRYDIRSFVVHDATQAPVPSDFVIRSEDYGVPQRRHRVILLGVRRDRGAIPHRLLSERAEQISVTQAIGDLPVRRSPISGANGDAARTWQTMREFGRALVQQPRIPGWRPSGLPVDFREWISPDDAPISLHEARRHMDMDLARYSFAANFAAAHGRSPRLADFPKQLIPNHRNVGKKDTPFIDRFKVQQRDEPSTTIVSHMAKDGHYYIHPDPKQMRSFTVREAARLQTFPDNYLFRGSRTNQFQQVGNAVPPLLARQLGEIVRDLILTKP